MSAPSRTGDPHRATTCAGFLAICGGENFSVRLAVVSGVIPAEALTPRADWPDLYSDYDEMAEANGVPPGHREWLMQTIMNR